MISNSSYEGTINLISQHTESKIIKDVEPKDHVFSDKGMNQLIENSSSVISKNQTVSESIVFREEESSGYHARCDIVGFRNSEVVYIEWLEIDPEIRGNDISRMLRKELVNDIGGRYRIYTYIESSRLITVVLDQGFRRIKEGGLQGLYVRPKS